MSEAKTMSGIKVERLDPGKLEELGVKGWPIWTKEESTFDWHYDARETCLILEGEVTVKTDDGEISLGADDYVTFPQGLSCVWTVKKAVRKHYNFG
jgi:uncharacterized cupin superfamily protein